ncbi:uncharacterized protein K02A2.6-like, partial [Ceratina calcarata]|uniref:RNA-directed DNA polymerase n=1 Tax=Ceratina calcarata TaxID=156304 RepID=A0AAJ7J1G9_9HYME
MSRGKVKHRQRKLGDCAIAVGHVEAACRGRKAQGELKFLTQEEQSEVKQEAEELDAEYEDFFPINIVSGNGQHEPKMYYVSSVQPMFVTAKLNGRLDLVMEVDTGTYLTVLSEKDKNLYFPELVLEKPMLKLKSYGSVKLHPLGVLKELKVELNGIKRELECYVLPGEGPPLIGRQWLEAFGMWPLSYPKQTSIVAKVNKIEESELWEQFSAKYPVLFGNTPGLFNKGEIRLVLKEGTKPIALKARHLPFALVPKVDEEIDRLLKLGHLEKVETSEWATPIVPIIKKDGKVRLAGNFKLTVNPYIVMNKYPLPLFDEIFAVLQGGEEFSEIDLAHAYMQLAVERQSRDCLTIITHRGLLRYTRLAEGVCVGPGEFQKLMEGVLAGISNTVAYLDNIYCTGKNRVEHLRVLNEVFDKLQASGLRVNKRKCKLFQAELDVLGFVISKNGVKKSPEKIRAMLESPRPTNTKQLQAFIGLITYYARFLPYRAEKMKPLYALLEKKNSDFIWSTDCETAFVWVKKELASDRVLAHYDPSKKLILACDASPYGLAAILSHEYGDGVERPIAYASKVIPKSELSRAQIDKEASAIIFGFKKFYRYVFGREIILKTDHKPLVYIFGPNKEIPSTIASRLQRWAYYLSGFKYSISYVKSVDNGNCDALSKLPVSDETGVFENEFATVNYFSEGASCVDFRRVGQETQRDEVLRIIYKYVNDGWPASESKLKEEEKPYWGKRVELNTEKNSVLWGYRVIIPKSLQTRVLEELHSSHLGVVKMKMIARSYFWWPGLDREIENVANSCMICLRERKKPQQVPLSTWPWPDRVWQRIHSDLLGPVEGKMFLIVIDAHSKWPEVVDMGQCTQSIRLIKEFRKIFSRHGLPKHVVTDCGPQYASQEFKKFLEENGIRQSFAPPKHPATNGAAENFVGTFKDKVKKIMKGGVSLERAVDLFLMEYRSTEHCSTGRSPAWMMYKRELRTRFDLLKPTADENVYIKQAGQIRSVDGKRKFSVEVGDAVMVDDYRIGKDKRVEGVV